MKMKRRKQSFAPARARGRLLRPSSRAPSRSSGMRAAGRLAAELLDRRRRLIAARRDDARDRPAAWTRSPATHGADERAARLRRGRPSRATAAPRSTTSSATASRDRATCCADGDIVNVDVTPHRGRLPRRHLAHLPGRRGLAEGAPPRGRHLPGAVARHPRGEARRAHRRHRPRHPELRRGAGLLGGARVHRARHRPRLPRPRRRSSTTASRGTGELHHARHDLHRRADDQPRPLEDRRSSTTAGRP